MGPPSLWHRFRQTVGRALRETGQALDRLGVKTIALANTPHDYYDDPVKYQDNLSRHRHLFPLLSAGRPMIDSDVAYLAPCSTLIGSVTVKRGASIWYGAVLRADRCENVESLLQSKTETAKIGENSTSNETALVDTEKTPSSISWKDSEEVWELDKDRLTEKSRLEYQVGGGIFIGEDTNVQDNCIITSRVDHCIIGNGVTIGHSAQIHSATVGDFCLIGMGSVISPGVTIGDEAFIAAGAVVPPNTKIEAGELWVGNPARKIRDLTAEQRARLHFQSSEYKLVATGQQGIMQLGGNMQDYDIFPEMDELQNKEKIDGDSKQTA